jgi:hypothetical protein
LFITCPNQALVVKPGAIRCQCWCASTFGAAFISITIESIVAIQISGLIHNLIAIVVFTITAFRSFGVNHWVCVVAVTFAGSETISIKIKLTGFNHPIAVIVEAIAKLLHRPYPAHAITP